MRNCIPGDAYLFNCSLESLAIVDRDKLERQIVNSNSLIVHMHMRNIPWPNDDLAMWYQAPMTTELRADWGYYGPMTLRMITFVPRNPNEI